MGGCWGLPKGRTLQEEEEVGCSELLGKSCSPVTRCGHGEELTLEEALSLKLTGEGAVFWHRGPWVKPPAAALASQCRCHFLS